MKTDRMTEAQARKRVAAQAGDMLNQGYH